jgi:putative addiction module component (TIGR02574 family)
MSRASILAEALKLPMTERAKLITELIDALEDETDDDPALVEQAWAAELEARIARADAHHEEAIDWSDLRAKLSAK